MRKKKFFPIFALLDLTATFDTLDFFFLLDRHNMAMSLDDSVPIDALFNCILRCQAMDGREFLLLSWDQRKVLGFINEF